jgi:hypothetical protein
VHATPIVDRFGRVRGVISTHWRGPYPEADYDPRPMLAIADAIAARVERGATESKTPRA